MQGNARTAGPSLRARAAAVLAVVSFIVTSPAVLAAPNGTDRPLGGACDTTFTVISFAFPIQVLDIDLTCHYTHLGLTTGHAIQYVDVRTLAITTEISLFAANGDELYATFTGDGQDNLDGTVSFTGTTTYIGGTGRFAGVSGWSIDTGVASLVTREGYFEASGKISY